VKGKPPAASHRARTPVRRTSGGIIETLTRPAIAYAVIVSIVFVGLQLWR
jgi:hypothetical protein